MLTAAADQYASSLPYTGLGLRWIVAAAIVLLVVGVVARANGNAS